MSDAATIAKTLVEIASITAAACGNSSECAAQGHADRPNRCCSRLYCEAARRYCQSKGIELTATSHPDLPFMGPSGCVLPPEHRPICAIHTCQWSNSAQPHCGNNANTDRYADLYWRAQSMDDGWWTAFQSVREEAGKL